MRIGIVPSSKPHDGGIYQYTAMFLDALRELSPGSSPSLEHDVVLFAHDPSDAAVEPYLVNGWTVKPFRPPWGPHPSINLDALPDPDEPLEQPDMRAWLLECGIDLMLYPSPHRLSFECGIPFVMAIHDLQHLLQPEFPEVSAHGEWRRREYLFRNATRNATLLIAESATGKDDIIRCYARYGVSRDRVKVLPYAPPRSIDRNAAREGLKDLREKHRLPQRYLFYPAQFWPHKNHLRLIEALGILKHRHGLSIPLVLTGTASDAIRTQVADELQRRCAALGMQDLVLNLGYVTAEEVASLYAGATALVMPTFFGPTNIPFLEAWSLDCPVLTSRIRGIVEQVQDAAVTVNPESVSDLAQKIRRLWTDDSLRQSLISKGRQRIASYGFADFRQRLADIIAEAVSRVDASKTICGTDFPVGQSSHQGSRDRLESRSHIMTGEIAGGRR